MRVLIVTGVLVAAAAAVASLRPAQAAPSATGELGAGGTALGDISKSGGETDAIGVDLVQGSLIDVRWNAGFAAAVSLVDPDGNPAALGLAGLRSSRVLGWSVPATGRWQFLVNATEGSQGNYKLTVTPKWDKTVALTGVDTTTFGVAMPAGGYLRGVLRAAPDASYPEFLSFLSPGGVEQLTAVVHGPARAVRWKGVATTEPGVYSLIATAGGDSRAYTGTLFRRAPRFRPTKIDLRNGIDPVSYTDDGVGAYFRSRCAPCHSWASTYTGNKAYARSSLGMMSVGKMPRGGPRADAATLDLVAQWILTGYPK